MTLALDTDSVVKETNSRLRILGSSIIQNQERQKIKTKLASSFDKVKTQVFTPI